MILSTRHDNIGGRAQRRRRKPGASYRLGMTAPDGAKFWLSGIYQDVRHNQRLTYTAAWEDAEGHRGHETLVTVTFDDQGSATKIVIHQARFASRVSRDSHLDGWAGTLENLAAFLNE